MCVLHLRVGPFDLQSGVVPPQPVLRAPPGPPVGFPPDQHEVVRVRFHKPHLVADHWHV